MLTQPFPPQLSSSHPEAAVAGSNSRHRFTGSDGYPQHLHHAKTTIAALKRPPRADERRAGTQTTLLLPTRCQVCRYKKTEDPSGASADQPDQLGGPRQQPTDLEKDSEGRRSDLRSRLNRRHAKAKRGVRKSHQRPPRNACAQQPPTCPRCQRTFRVLIGLVGHLRINCATRIATAIARPSNCRSSLSSTLPTNADRSLYPLLTFSSSSSSPSSPSSSSSSTAPTSAVVAPDMHINTTRNLHTTADTNTTAGTRGEDQDYTRSHCDIGLVGHLRIHRTVTGEPVPGAPTHTRCTALAHSHIAWASSATRVSMRE
nr:unnamed protein product [Spirometra erinaceieuropaei]